MSRIHIPIAFLLAVFSAGALPQQRDENETVSIGEHDPEMVAAISKARASLGEFLRLAADPPAGTEGYKLKVMVIDGARTEHFWVTPFKVLPDGFAGVIANEPKVVTNVRAGEVVRFDESLITDWGYVRNGRQVGSYTVCVLFRNMPAEQAAYYRTHHGFDC